MTKTRILLVEDDEELADLIGDYLRGNDMEVELVTDGAAANATARSFGPDLVVLDVMLPGKDGLEICRELRTWFSGPVLFLTARSNWVDQIVGLELGADDYLGKPIEPRLLLARVRALLRRADNGASRNETTAEGSESSLAINERTRVATLGGRDLDLTDAEFDLLAYLKAHAGEHLTREQLSRDVCETDYDGLGRTIDVRIGRLRTKLGDDAKKPRWIKSIRGVGYLFVESDS